MNVISDVAGRYDELMLLLDKMPIDKIIFVGDLVDRGLDSNKVINFAMKTGRTILGNHEHMMLYHFKNPFFYGPSCWFYNGGMKTLDSYNGEIPEEVFKWIESLPLYIEFDNFFISHSCIPDYLSLEDSLELEETRGPKLDSILWNRSHSKRRDKIQIFGHNSQWGYTEFKDNEGVFAVCIDDSKHKKLTGIHLPSMEIYQQEYLK